MKPLQQTRLLLVAVLTATACALNPQPIPPDDDSRASEGDSEQTPGTGGASGMNGSSGGAPPDPGSFDDAGALLPDGGHDPDAGDPDAGSDAGSEDAGPEDAGPSDAGDANAPD